jgi:dTMP kinase
MTKGIFITFEGSEGCGKSTQSRLLYLYLKKKGFPVLYLREPGSTKVGEKIRRVLLDAKNDSMVAGCEMLLYMASRAQLAQEVIIPAFKKGNIIICDRFLDSTLAYQGYGLGTDIKLIRQLGNYATLGLSPDLTILLDLPVKSGLNQCGKTKDRIELRPMRYHFRVRQGYLKLAALYPERIKIIPVAGEKKITQEAVRQAVFRFLKKTR